MKVTDIMTKDVASCKADASLRSVAGIMIEKDCGAIPVTDDEGKPIGIITDRDIVTRTLGAGKDPNSTSVGDTMSSHCVTVGEEAGVEEVCRVMEEDQIRRVVVVDQTGRCRGIVAQADIAQHLPKRKAGEVVREVSQSGRLTRAAGRALWSGTATAVVTLGAVAAAAFLGGVGVARRSRSLVERLPLPRLRIAKIANAVGA